MPTTFDDLVAALAGRYEIEREVGRGGMSMVYLATDPKHRRQVALKVLDPEVGFALGSDRFMREIEIAAGLSHPHILPVYDSGEVAAGQPPVTLFYYVMPFVGGESLRARLTRVGPLPVEEAVRFACEVADALAYAHERGIVHRDVKPENILISGGHAVVTDFGVARAIGAAGGDRLTQTGLAVGTPAYMSPEQAAGERELDGRSDIYSLGCVLYEMLTGGPPFAGESARAITARKFSVAPAPPRSRRPAVPEAVERATLHALQPAPADRPATARDFGSALARAAGSGRASSGAQRTPRGAWRRGAAAAAGLALLALIAWLARRGGHAQRVVPGASTVAVLPLGAATDTSLARLARDLVFTVSASLDGVGGIKTVDPHTVLAQTTEGLALAESRALGHRLGATSVMHGSMVRAGGGVRLDVGLFPADSGPPLVRLAIAGSPDSIAALTDSVTYGLLRAVWRAGTAPSPSLDVALRTRSVHALRAFLEGEQLMAANRFEAAADAYGRALEADSTFTLALGRYAYAMEWTLVETDSARASDLARRYRDLPERERGLVESGLLVVDSVSRSLDVVRDVVQRHPDYWLGWLVYADRLTHFGGLAGYGPIEAREAFEQTVRLNPRLIPGWEHLMLVALQLRDTAAAAASLARLTELGAAGPLAAQGFGDAMLCFRLVLPILRGDTAGGTARIDSLAADVAQHQRVGTTFYEPFRYGLFATQIALTRKALRLGPVPSEVRGQQTILAYSWIARGAWDSALVAADTWAARDDDATAPLLPFQLAVVGAWLDVVDPADAERRRPAAARAAAQLGSASQVQLTWLDGVLAAARGDRAALAAARQRLAATEGEPDEPAWESLVILELALSDSAAAGRRLAAADRRATEQAYRSTSALPFLLPLHRLAAARWLGARDPTAAARLLGWLDLPYLIHPSQYAGLSLRGFYARERARLAAAVDPATAIRRYREVLETFDLPSVQVRPLVEEARAQLRRLGAPSTAP